MTIEELEKILGELNAPNVNIDKLEERVKRGIELIAACCERLRKVEADIEKVLAPDA